MVREQLDALVVVHTPNVRYLTGFQGSSAILILFPDRLHLITDGRYVSEVQQDVAPRCVGLRAVPVTTSYDAALAAAIRSVAGARIGIESQYMTVARHAWLTAQLAEGNYPGTLVPVEGLTEAGRLIKDAHELAILREGAAMLDEVVTEVFGVIRWGQREFELAAEIDYRLRRKGFDRTAFDTIVASGPNAAMPHARPGSRVFDSGDLVVLDFGGVLDGYHLDITRTVCLGQPSPWAKRVVGLVSESQEAALARVRPGVLASDVDDAARRVLEQNELGATFSHATGHGLGLEIHEAPRVGPVRDVPGVARMMRDTVLEPGMVFTIEPGVYMPGQGGVRFEDDVLVTESGCEVLTRAPRELFVVRR